jgi:PadR family transcriptional regulator, regulatory protein AphA
MAATDGILYFGALLTEFALDCKGWTAYELAKQMERAVHYFWPRAERKLYDEAKNLVAHGLASARKDHVGRRPRTVYAITGRGRRALRRWLARDNAPHALEFEAVAKIFFADQGSKQELLTNVRSVSDEASRYLEHLDRLARETVGTGGGPFPERAHINVLTFTFGWAFADALLRWSKWAETEVEKWSDVNTSPQRSRWALRIFGEATELVAKERAVGVPWRAP